MIKWYLLLAMLLSGCTTTNEQSELPSLADIPPESREALINNAQKAELNKQFDKAIVLYVKALEQEYSDDISERHKIKNTQIFYNIGLLEIKQGHDELALTAFKHLLQQEPSHHLAQTQLGILYLKQKQKKQATKLLIQAITADQQRLGNTTGTPLQFVELDNKSPLAAYSAFAVLQDLNGEHLGAIRTQRLILPISPQDPSLLTNLGYSYYLSGNLIEAEINYKNAIDIDAQFKQAWLNLGLVYTRKGMFTKALQTLKQVIPTEHAYNDIGYFLMLDRRYDEAKYFLERAIEISPSYFVRANENLENVNLELSKIAYTDNHIKTNLTIK